MLEVLEIIGGLVVVTFGLYGLIYLWVLIAFEAWAFSARWFDQRGPIPLHSVVGGVGTGSVRRIVGFWRARDAEPSGE